MMKVEQKLMNPDLEHQERMDVERAWGEYSPQFDKRDIQAAWTERADLHNDPEYQKLTLQQKKTREQREAKKRGKQLQTVDA